MRYFLLFSVLIFGFPSCKHQNQEPIFPKGIMVNASHFTGNVWLQMLVPNDTLYNINAGSVTFEPSARTYWHYHPGGQILLVTEGEGYYQEKGKPIQKIQKGDVVTCKPMVEHWHGATNQSAMTHIAIGAQLHKGNVVWKSEVSVEQYPKL